MLSLVYVSTSTKLLSAEELLDILKVSRVNNAAKEITGLLLYKGGNFMQALEGPDEAVLELYEKIKTDPRHKNAFLISKEQIHSRQFSNWGMAFTNLDTPDIKNEPGFSQFLHDELTANVYHQDPHLAYIMLLAFRDNLS